jgi:BirA family biotin operon repressor/biotin-[acetyl-CoA-carboxylase] ligase
MDTLGIETLFIGRNCYDFEEMASTNEWLIAHSYLRKMPEGTLVVTKNQTRGKGQRGSDWVAEASSSLTFSILLRPVFILPSQAFDLSICTALAIHQCLNDLRPGFFIKWPNDIFFQDKKIAGVLIENQFRNKHYQNAIIGIGLNINQNNFKDLPKAISLRQILGISFPAEKVMCKICELLEGYYLQLRAGNFNSLKEMYITRLYGFGEWRFFKVYENIFRAKITDIHRNGHLQLTLPSGDIQNFNIKQLKFH